MSTLAEIEAAIEKLRPEEFSELAAWMDARRGEREIPASRVREAMDKVFDHHAPLLDKLAR
ncbi:hypothetical protein OJ996_20370 [Luteolibacter sp. GHJ8]|uniref:Uncharacterized protein n=1 Tax=Luteolibacter rhizosphaerae TaxID=2989719 RepID=A0ABT3G7Z2_9BACT|nr:hypothetical protein [Luteolibacter rhizosphaerae]MCW1915955.1 hypothetical protein [Luteolibacter rhizosphaerae]